MLMPTQGRERVRMLFVQQFEGNHSQRSPIDFFPSSFLFEDFRYHVLEGSGERVRSLRHLLRELGIGEFQVTVFED